MYILDVSNNEKGSLYTQKLHLTNGLFLSIKHSIANKLSLTTKQINFVHLSFNRQGDRFIASDLHGNIYMFDLNYNRFMRLNRIGTTCTALAYNLKCKTEYLVATVDGTIKCFNVETRELVGWMKGHEKPIMSLSVHSNGEFVISFSADVAQLWDLKTFECKQKLNINAKKNVEIVKISFAPATNDIVCVFKDDTIYVWAFENVEFKCQLGVKECDMIFYKCFAISNDGKLLVAAGRTNKIQIWSIENRDLLKTITLDEDINTIKDCIILSGFYENKILVLLTQDGMVEVINVESEKSILTMNKTSHQNANEKINSIFTSPNSRYLCAITENGFVQVYDLDCSQIAKFKSTATLMKTSINSTNVNTLSNVTNSATSETTTKTNQSSSKTNQNLRKFNQSKPAVCKRAQKVLNNDHIYTKLVQILKCYGEYPARYRMFIWKMLLRLPENYESYSALIEKGTHPAFIDLHKKYPIKSQKCTRLLQRTLSVLANWCPLFAECEYLPLMVFPFVKLYQNNHVICFELVATLIMNWCQYWFEFFPNPPMNILNMVENLVSYHDKNLIEHYVRYRITSQIYGWSLLETIFSEVFSKHEWQILFDNIFSNHPGYVIYLVAAYSICNRTALLKCTEIDDASFFFRHRNPVTVHHLMREAQKMIQCTPNELNPIRLLSSFEPLAKGTYPIFNKRPRFISDYQVREKNKILQQEIDYLKERDIHLESHKQIEGQKLENEFILKKMLWDNKNQQGSNSAVLNERSTFKDFRDNLSRYESIQNKFEVNVAGKPTRYTDENGSTYVNKMRKIEENFDDLEHHLGSNNENENDANEDEFSNELNELIANSSNNRNARREDNSRMSSASGVNRCLNDCEASATSSIFSLERGRENLEFQERELMRRVYDMRKTIALDNRKPRVE